MKTLAPIVLLLLGLVLTGCQSSIVPMRPLEQVYEDVSTQPATATAPALATTTTAPETQAASATTPARKLVKMIDPNQTVRYLYRGNYDRIWQESMLLLARMGFRLDRQDYRLGTLTTFSLPSPQFVEPWRRDNADFLTAFENTINDQRRSVRLTIRQVPEKPEFFEIAVQVVVERLTNPTEVIGGPAFRQGSGFGRSSLITQTDYLEFQVSQGRWILLGHDTKLEKKILDSLFKNI